MTQNGRTRGGTFHDEMDRCRENVEKGKRGACRRKAATVLPNRTAAT